MSLLSGSGTESLRVLDHKCRGQQLSRLCNGGGDLHHAKLRKINRIHDRNKRLLVEGVYFDKPIERTIGKKVCITEWVH